MDSKTRAITRTAIFIAILVAMQYATGALGNTYITGSMVNLILIVSVMTCGPVSAAVVSVISPFVAYFFGIGTAFVQLVPFIALGNLVLVLVWHLLGNRKLGASPYPAYALALVLAAAAKFATLYLTIVKLAVPSILQLEAGSPPAMAMSLNFSYPQLVTAAIGGLVAILILPTLKKAIR